MLLNATARRPTKLKGPAPVDQRGTIMKLKPLAVALAAASFLGFAIPRAIAQTNAISFDADGTGGVTQAINMATFDWAVSSLLSTTGVCPVDQDGVEISCNKTIPILDLVNPTHLKALTHARLNPVIDANGNPTGLPIGLNTAYEVTFVAGSCIVAMPAGSVQLLGGIMAPRSLNLSLSTSPLCLVDPEDPTSPSGRFFEIWYDDLGDGTGVQSNALTGQGYRDGKLILSGKVVTLTGTNAFAEAVPTQDAQFDQFGGVNNYPGITTVIQKGSTSLQVLVEGVDKAFFVSGVDQGSILPFTGEVTLPFKQTNPSANFYSGELFVADHSAAIGPNNGSSGPDFQQQADASNAFQFVPPELACRVTGGGNDTAGLLTTLDGYDGTVAMDRFKPSILLKPKGKQKRTSSSSITPDYYDYSFGGQAGANTAQQPQPKGQWEHNNHSSPTGLTFAFHGGKNAPDGTQIDEIRCTDPESCVQARPAPDKQIDFVGIGTFSNISGLNALSLDGQGDLLLSDGVIFNGIQDVIPEPKTGQPGLPVPTYHWFQVHIEDLGEPGSQQGLTDAEDPVKCPPKGSGNDPFANPAITDKLADCGCKDFYRITIYKGVQPAVDGDGKVVLDANGDIPNINKTDKIYEVYGYINGGNFQIHPLTGFDLK